MAIGLPAILPPARIALAPCLQQEVKSLSDVKDFTNYTLEQLEPLIYNEFKKGSNVEQVINMLRAGGFDDILDSAKELAIMAVIYYALHRVGAFDPSPSFYNPRIPQILEPNGPGQGPYVGGYGKGTGPRSLTVLQNTASDDDYISTKMIRNAYAQIPTVAVEGTDLEITAYDTARKAYHCTDFNLDYTAYGLTANDMDIIREHGLTHYANTGRPLPSPEFVKAYQSRLKGFVELPFVKDCGDNQTVMGGPAIVYRFRSRGPSNGLFVAFDPNTKQMISGWL